MKIQILCPNCPDLTLKDKFENPAAKIGQGKNVFLDLICHACEKHYNVLVDVKIGQWEKIK